MSTERRATIGVTVAAATLMVLAGLSFSHARRALQLSADHRGAQAVLTELESLLSLVKGAESDIRRFVVTGDGSDQIPFLQLTQEVDSRMASLRSARELSVDQAQHLDALHTDIKQRITLLSRLADLRSSEGFEAAQAFTRTGAGQREMEQVEAGISRLRTLVENQRDRSATAFEQSTGNGTLAFGSMAGIVMVLIGFVYFALTREIADRRRAESEASRLNSQLSNSLRELEIKNREVERATQLKSEFLASMSHELRTPLNAIVGFSDLLGEQTSGPLNAKQQRFVGHVRDGSRHLLRLINDILDLSKIEAGQIDLQLEDFESTAALPEILSSLRPLVIGKKLDLQSDLEPLWIHADRVRFKQVLFNLISNAIKFTPEGGRIRLTSRREGDMVVVSVADTGIGIPPEFHQQVFEEFKQVDRTTSGVKEGTGLGLAICKRLVEQHGGKIWLRSAPGVGSEFFFSIPLGKELASTASTSRSVQRDRPLILVIDDDSASREVLCSFLEPVGYQTIEAASAADGIRLAREALPDVITLNMLSPGKGGWEALWELKAHRGTGAIPIVIVSIVDQQKMAFALGAAEYLVKPIVREDLIASVQRQIGVPSSNKCILVVDDDPACVQMMSESLTAGGYRTLCAYGGREALEHLEERRPDAILLDLLMPEIDGFEVIRQLRSREELKTVPVFVITAKDLTPDDLDILRSSTRALFRKGDPWREHLLDYVKQAVGYPARATGA